MLNIASLAVAAISVLHLKGPDDELLFSEKLPVTVTLHSPGSEAFAAAEAKRNNRSIARGRKKKDVTAEALRDDQIDFLADVTASFGNFDYPVDDDTAPRDMFRAVYADRRIGFVADQVVAHLADWSNFTKGSALS